MSEALYRKYRPSTFDDVVGQEHIERTLKNALEQEKVSHAYLFCGPRGTGKTTMARILAKALLCEKAPTIEPDGTCEECQAIAAGTHPDVYELDAASRTGVENVREEIINRVHYAPTRGSYKIYIIDEVHMLSTAAFNALLKTLEEPPTHVVFILCTTDPQKVPDTIHSRCQRFDFHRLSVDEIVARLGAVCVQEDVEFEPEALELIAHQAEGGMRNALTSLEQLAAFGEGRVTLEGAHRILGSLDNEGLSEIVQALGRRDAAACFTWVSRYVETGADVAQFVQELAEHMRNLYLLSLTDADVEISASTSARASMESELELFGTERLSRTLSVLGDLMKELRATTNSRLAFEIALTRLLRPESDLTMESLAERLEELELKMLSMPAGVVQAAPQMAPSIPSAQPAVVLPQQAVSAPSQPSPVVQTAPISQPAVAPQPAAASQAPLPSQPAAAPTPAPAPQTVPAPQPTPAPQAVPTPQPVPAVSPASAPQATPAPSPEPVSNAPAAALDYSNAAALQRMWHQVTTTLRKSNPARGVLFMGAKVEPDPQNGGVKIVFSPDSSFAYAAAQKKEVKDLLAQTFIEVAGGAVPFELVMAGGAPASAAAPAAASSQAMPSATVAPQPAPQSAAPAVPQSAPQSTQGTSVPQVAPQPIAAAPVSASSGSQAPQETSVPAAPAVGRYEDESPFWDDDPSADYQAPAQTPAAVPAPSSSAAPTAAAAPVPAPASVSAPAPSPEPATSAAPAAPAFSGASAPAPQPANDNAPAAQPEDAPEGALSESDQIKQILTASFGDGVKFDTI